MIPRPHTRALPVARGLLASHFESLIRRDVSRWLASYVRQLGLAPAALRYVLAHELCHLKVRNHSPRFWALVETLFPGWREQRDWLRQNGSLLKAELDRLVADVAD